MKLAPMELDESWHGRLLWLTWLYVYMVVVQTVLFTWFREAGTGLGLASLSRAGHTCWLAYTLCAGAMGLALFRAGTSDPGLVKPSAVPVEVDDPRFCRFCPSDQWIPPRAHHCRTCGRCVFFRSHHCQVVGNCVGWGNWKIYFLFLVYTFLFFAASLALLALALVLWVVGPSSTWGELGAIFLLSKLAKFIFASAAALACLCGLGIVACALFVQVKSQLTNTTPSEADRALFGKERRFGDQWCRLFGPRWWLWPLPVPAHVAPDYAEKVYRAHPITDRVEEAPRLALSPIEANPRRRPKAAAAAAASCETATAYGKRRIRTEEA